MIACEEATTIGDAITNLGGFAFVAFLAWVLFIGMWRD